MTDRSDATLQRPLWKRLWYQLTQLMAGSFFRVWFRLRREGHHRPPASGPMVVASNHASHLDPVLIGTMLPRQICYLARETLFRGVLGPLIRSYDSVPIDREGSGLSGIRAILKRLKMNDAVLLFPEGTRTRDGRLQPMQPGFIALVRRGKATLAPVGISGSFEAMPRGVLLPRPAKIGLVYGDPIPPERMAGLSDEELLELVRTEIAACCQRAAELAGRG